MTAAACLIINPASGRGRARDAVRSLREVFGSRGVTEFFVTASPGDEETFAMRALAEGMRTIVVVGGDGTCSRVATVILRAGSECRLAVVPTGTGNDFAKTLGVDRHTSAEIADLVVGGRETHIDVGSASGNYFINSCGFGFDASVLEASNRVRFLQGNAVYIYSALRQLFTYRGIDVGATGAQGVKRGIMLMVTVSIGKWLGGAFNIAPHASAVDGKLDVCFFSDSSVLQRVRLFAGALRGTHLGMDSVRSLSVEQLALSFPASPFMEIDGELRIAADKEVELKCLPGALRVVAAPGAAALQG
ncbi:MAG: diacylglycerol/lipid kinase family protein [Gemmatimonadaceae bacterium]